jgi:hypothetical protein
MRRLPGSLLTALVATATLGCGPLGRDVHDAFNTRETGPYLGMGREWRDDGTLVIRVMARRPQHAQEIARHIVLQNYASSTRLQIIVLPTGQGRPSAYEWDGSALTDVSATLQLPASPGSAR